MLGSKVVSRLAKRILVASELKSMRASSTGSDKGEVTVINGGISIRARGGRPRHLAPIHYEDDPPPAAGHPRHPAPCALHPCNKLGHRFRLVRSSGRRFSTSGRALQVCSVNSRPPPRQTVHIIPDRNEHTICIGTMDFKDIRTCNF